jgi:hypothetical protein
MKSGMGVLVKQALMASSSFLIGLLTLSQKIAQTEFDKWLFPCYISLVYLGY